MSDLASFFHMGGYAVYVWPSFMLSALVILANVYFSKREYKNVVSETVRRHQAKQAQTTPAQTKPKQTSAADKQG